MPIARVCSGVAGNVHEEKDWLYVGGVAMHSSAAKLICGLHSVADSDDTLCLQLISRKIKPVGPQQRMLVQGLGQLTDMPHPCCWTSV